MYLIGSYFYDLVGENMTTTTRELTSKPKPNEDKQYTLRLIRYTHVYHQDHKLTKVISSRLADSEHEAAIEMANILGESLSEFVHNSIMNELCLSWKKPQLEGNREEKIQSARDINDKRFLGSEKESILVTWSRMLREAKEKRSTNSP